MESLKRVKIPSFLKEKLIVRLGDHYQMHIIVMAWKRKHSVDGYVFHYEKIIDRVNGITEPLTRNLEHKFKAKSKTFNL